MNPYLQALLRRVMSQTETPGTDQSIRPGMPWQRLLMGLADPGIYGQGARVGGDAVMPPQVSPAVTPWLRQSGIARNVLRGLEQGQDVNLTGSGLELSPAELAGQRSALDMLLQHLGQGFGQDRPKSLTEEWR